MSLGIDIEKKTSKLLSGNIFLFLVIMGGIIFSAFVDKLLLIAYFCLCFAYYFYKFKKVQKSLFLGN